jgi:1-acyl-sn-glycerol-3-phosphate acyltransferase
MFPRYPFPWPIALRLLQAILFKHRRSFGVDARACLALLRPALVVEGKQYIPAHGPCLITVNHYARKGFFAWWLALAISAIVPAEIHWITTSAWVYPDRLRSLTITPVTRWLLKRIAQVYDFTPMPPMPPKEAEVTARAQAVRRVLAYVHRTPQAIIGLAPEGRDFAPADGNPAVLGVPPPGLGRFVMLLSQQGLDIVPVAAYETQGAFCLNFGAPYRPHLPAGLSPEERDRWLSRLVMEHIAAQLPPGLRGAYGPSSLEQRQ